MYCIVHLYSNESGCSDPVYLKVAARCYVKTSVYTGDSVATIGVFPHKSIILHSYNNNNRIMRR